MTQRRKRTDSKYTRTSENSEKNLEVSGGYNKDNPRQTGEITVDYSKPAVVSDELIFEIFKFASRGFPQTKVAEEIGMSLDKLKKLRDENELVEKAFSQGQQAAVEDVEYALYRKALGFEKEVEELKFNNKTGTAERVKVNRYFQPDINAIKYFLSHNRPEKYTQKGHDNSKRNSVQFKETKEINFSGVDMSDKDKMREALEKVISGNGQ
jgi:hypothetical protein